MKENGKNTYKVSEITSLIKTTLESSFGYVEVEGELSNFRASGAGHLYFTLKDESAAISAVMFRGRTGGLRFTPEDGMLVVVSGTVSVYEKRGVYQIICDSMRQAGIGTILALIEERKKLLAAEGLFDQERKNPIPLFPSRVAVVTSSTGAALRDIIQVLSRRNAGCNLVVLPAQVQGDGAAEKIAAQIRRANMFKLGEVLIVGRGGGSLEDLLPFSEEVVVRAVANSEVPVISAVGHEIDYALSDFAADVRAPTPSAAAELVSINREDLLLRVIEMKNTLRSQMEYRTERVRMLLDQFSADNLERNFRMLVQPFLQRLDDAKEDILSGLTDRVRDYGYQVRLLKESLLSNSPKEIMKKGYALVEDEREGSLVRSASQTEAGRGIVVRFFADSLRADVRETEPKESEDKNKGERKEDNEEV